MPFFHARDASSPTRIIIQIRPTELNDLQSYLAELLNPELLKLLLKQRTQEDCKRILDGRVEALRLWLSDHEADLKRASMRATSREDEQEITRMRERVKAQFGLG